MATRHPEPARRFSGGVAAGLLFLAVAIAALAYVLGTRHDRPSTHGEAATNASRARVNKHHHPAATTTTATTTTTTTATTTTVARIAVPALAGSSRGALQRLYDAGFQASVAYVPSSRPFGTVVAQSPPPGTTAPAGSHVTVNVSSGHAQNEQRTVPNTVGLAVPAAVAAVNRAGLRLTLLKRQVTDQSQAGKVVGQTPAAGAQAPRNSQVVVYMGAFSTG